MENIECGENYLVQSYERQITHLEQYLSCKQSNKVVQFSINKLTKALLDLKQTGFTTEGEKVILDPKEVEKIWNNLHKRKIDIIKLTPLNDQPSEPPLQEALMLNVSPLNVMVWTAHEFLSRFNFLAFDSNFERKKKYAYSVTIKGSNIREVKYEFILSIEKVVIEGEHMFQATLTRKEKEKHGKKVAASFIPLDQLVDFKDVSIDKMRIEYAFNEFYQTWKRLWEYLTESQTPSISVGRGGGPAENR